MTTDNWMQLLVVTVLAGAFVSKTTHVVLSRVHVENPSRAQHESANYWRASGPQSSNAAQELALLIGVDPSDIAVTFTAGYEVHCSVQAGPDELLELTKPTEAAIDQAFRERYRWTDLPVVVQFEARPERTVAGR